MESYKKFDFPVVDPVIFYLNKTVMIPVDGVPVSLKVHFFSLVGAALQPAVAAVGGAKLSKFGLSNMVLKKLIRGILL